MRPYIQILLLSIVCILNNQCHSNSQNSASKTPKHEAKKEHVKKLNSNRPNLNISLFLDLSDRISPSKHPNQTMEYYQRDLGYISSIATAFNVHIRNKKIIQMNDRMQVFFDPPPSNPKINGLAKKLKIELTKENVTREILSTITSNYKNFSKQIYELAITDNKYIGSDIWRFFKSNANTYCIKDGYRNVLIIFTDGYVYHKDTRLREGNKRSYLTTKVIESLGLNTSNWKHELTAKEYGFLAPTNGLSELEVLVLGINPSRNNPYEEDVIKAYWENWLKEMGVQKFLLRTTDLPSNLDEVIQNFLLHS
ncbi:MAG: hypothetical protein ACEPOZ_20040 [Marinifilaceae bacterium]